MCIFYQRWYNVGVRYIKDLLDDNGVFLSFQAFTQKYNLNDMNFLYHMQCVQAVKAFLRRNGVVIQNKNSSKVNVTHDNFANVKGSQKYYKILLPPTRLNFSIKWEAKLQCNIDWNAIFSLVHQISEIKLKWFQTRIIHRILGTNICLKNMNLRLDDHCSFCNRYRENISHIFVDCDVVKDFLDQFKTLLMQADIVSNNFSFEPLLLLFGYSTVNKDEMFFYVMLVLRYFIYKCRCEGSLPAIVPFKQYLHKQYLVELHIARQNYKIVNFEIKWFKWHFLFL